VTLALERRYSDRLAMPGGLVREANGEYHFSYRAVDLSEEGIFLEGRFLVSSHETHSVLSFTLPNGVAIRNVTARIVREDRKGLRKGCAYEFLDMSEDARMELKKFFHEHAIRGTA
jgi:hypothetical protein